MEIITIYPILNEIIERSVRGHENSEASCLIGNNWQYQDTSDASRLECSQKYFVHSSVFLDPVSSSLIRLLWKTTAFKLFRYHICTNFNLF